MPNKIQKVPHLWLTRQHGTHLLGRCYRCGWMVFGKDLNTYIAELRNQDTTTDQMCLISTRQYHEIYIDPKNRANWICHHCGATGSASKTEKAICIYPPPEREKEVMMKPAHTWSYMDLSDGCYCTCTDCGYHIVAVDREDAQQQTVQIDQGIPCNSVKQVPSTGASTQEISYGEKCANLLAQMVYTHSLLESKQAQMTLGNHEYLPNYDVLLQRMLQDLYRDAEKLVIGSKEIQQIQLQRRRLDAD